jgi:Electron transfer DM13
MSEPRRWWSRRRVAALAFGVVAATVIAVGLALFQPWKLWIDDKVDEAAPAGAVPITASAATAPEPTSPPTSATPTTVERARRERQRPPRTTLPPTTTTTPPTTLPPMPVGGEFVGIDHGTSGTVVLLQDRSGTRFVRLENLDTSNGPDLFVYLSTNPPDGEEGAFDDDYVNLGRLEGNLGSSNYVVPPGTDLMRFNSVVIWCDRFDSAFGAAPLN